MLRARRRPRCQESRRRDFTQFRVLLRHILRPGDPPQRLGRGGEVITGLDWSDLPRPVAREILAELLGVEDERKKKLKVSGKSRRSVLQGMAPRLAVRRQPHGCGGPRPRGRLGPVEPGAAPLLLDGSSAPVHETNAKEDLELDDAARRRLHPLVLFADTANDSRSLFEKRPDRHGEGQQDARSSASR